MNLTGLDIFSAGVIVVGVARLILVLALYLFYKEVSGSEAKRKKSHTRKRPSPPNPLSQLWERGDLTGILPPLPKLGEGGRGGEGQTCCVSFSVWRSERVAGLATLLYMTQPFFLLFNAQFAYESLGLPLSMLLLFATARRKRATGRVAVGLSLVIVLGLGAVVVTHHVSSTMLLGYLSLWLMIGWYPQNKGNKPSVRTTALLAFVAVVAWMLYVATLAIGYLAPHLVGALSELTRMIAGELTARVLFQSASGELAPLWQRITGIASVGLILLLLPFGLLLSFQQHRQKPIALVLMIVALAYPATLGLRFTSFGLGIAARAWGFLFVGIGFVLAVALLHQPHALKKWAIFACWITVIFIGGVIVGYAPWTRLPGPYLVTADMRSIELQGITAAQWTKSTLGSGNRMATDRINRMLLGTYGEQYIVTPFGDQVPVIDLFLSEELGKAERAILQAGQVQYILVDKRLSSDLPILGFYFDQGEPNSMKYKTPLDLAALSKFDDLDQVSRIFDSGDIVIVDVRGLIKINAP